MVPCYCVEPLKKVYTYFVKLYIIQFIFFSNTIKYFGRNGRKHTFCQVRSTKSQKQPAHPCSLVSLGFPHVEILHPCLAITKTFLYNFDPLKSHFYIVKLGFTGVYIIFLISAQNIDCGYSLEPPRRGGSNEYPQSMF